MDVQLLDRPRPANKERTRALPLYRPSSPHPLSGHEILIDPPSTKDIFDYADLRELRVLPSRKEHGALSADREGPYVRFDDFGESVFRSDFILSFERYTKKFRIVCREDLVPLLCEHQEEVTDILRKA